MHYTKQVDVPKISKITLTTPHSTEQHCTAAAATLHIFTFDSHAEKQKEQNRTEVNQQTKDILEAQNNTRKKKKRRRRAIARAKHKA